MKIKAALFDLDGVIIDTETQYSRFWGEQCRHYFPDQPGLENVIKGQTLVQIYDHVFADLEQQVFSCQPSLLFAQKVPYGWFSELMCLGYISYFPLIAAVSLYYYFQRYQDFLMATFVIIASFFA